MLASDWFTNPVADSDIEPLSGEVRGIKWEDLNGNGHFDTNEIGIGGVTIYSDLNRNARWDSGEPHTVTMYEDPVTDFDEGGRYHLDALLIGNHVIREVVPTGFEPTYPQGGGRVIDSTTTSYGPGVAIDFDVTGVNVVPSTTNTETAVDLELTVVWPDSCGSILPNRTSHSVAGNHLLVQMYAKQVGEICAEVISPETQTVHIDGLQGHRFEVIASLHESLDKGSFTPTLAFVGNIAIDSAGTHRVALHAGEVIDGIDFGNRPLEVNQGSVQGMKWSDVNGNGTRDQGESGLAGVVVYSDLNFNGKHDADEPTVRTREDDPRTPINETGQYVLDRLTNGLHLIREIVPEGFRQTFPLPQNTPEPANVDILPPSDGSHMVYVHSDTVIRGIHFGNQPLTAETGSIQGTKWIDHNGNGRRDPNEPGLPGVTIYLDTNLNGEFDHHEPHTVTLDDNTTTGIQQQGHYRFAEVEPGFYIVREVVPQGYKQTFPEVFLCKAPFCIGRGHMVNIAPGQNVTNLDFGNQPASPQLGSIHGHKWLDRNGNGQQESAEPGLPGVRIYIDLNNNGRPDRNEPRTVTRRDNPRTDFDEGGLYRFDGLVAGEYVVREIVPKGFVQTFPVNGAEILYSQTTPMQPGPAYDYQLTEITEKADTAGLSMSFTVIWRNGCGALLTNQTSVSVEGHQINVEMFGKQRDNICVQALIPKTYTVQLPPLPSGTYDLKATLHNVTSTGNFDASFLVEGEISIGGNGSHTVQLEPNETVEGIHFGNRHRRFIDDAPVVIWDGDVSVGTTGDGQSWSDKNNWSRDDAVDFELVPAFNLPHIFFLPAQTVGNIRIDNDQTIASLHFMENYELEGADLTVTSGEVSVAEGITAMLNTKLESTAGITKTGEGKLIVDTAVGDVTVSQGTWEGSRVTGNLQVQAGAVLSPGHSTPASDISPGFTVTSGGEIFPIIASYETERRLHSQHDPLPVDLLFSSGRSLELKISPTTLNAIDDLADTATTRHLFTPTTDPHSAWNAGNKNDLAFLRDWTIGLDEMDL